MLAGEEIILKKINSSGFMAQTAEKFEEYALMPYQS